MWDTATWSLRHRLLAETGPVGAQALAFTPDGRQLAVSMDFAACVLDVATGKEVRRFPKQSIGMNAVAVSPDGATLATTGYTIKLWDIKTGQEQTPSLSGHGGSVESVAFSPDGATVATGSCGQHGQALGRHDTARTDDASGAHDIPFSRWRSVPTASCSHRSATHPRSCSGILLQANASTPGQQSVTWAGGFASARTVAGSRPNHSPGAADASFAIWDVATGKQITKVASGDGSYMFAPDGKKLIFAGRKRWSAASAGCSCWISSEKKWIARRKTGCCHRNSALQRLSPDGKVVALAGWVNEDDEKGKAIVVLWDLAADRPLYQFDQWADHLAFHSRRSHAGGRRPRWEGPGVGPTKRHLAADDPGLRGRPVRDSRRRHRAGQPAFRGRDGQRHGPDFPVLAGTGTSRAPRPAAGRGSTAGAADGLMEATDRQAGTRIPRGQGLGRRSAVKIADLRGKFVLLHFWNTTSGLQMSHMVGLHQKFADQGLVIIAVQPDWGIATVKEWQAHASRQREWGDRALPFRIALDGGGKTPIAQTGTVAPSATFAAFGVQNGRGGLALQPVNLLIGPDGRVLMGVDSPWSLERELEARMGVKAKVPGWRDRFERRYALADGQVLKRVGPPYPPERADYLLAESRPWQNDSAHSEVFRWDGHLHSWAQSGACRLEDVLGSIVLDLRRSEFEGPADLLNLPVPGDWVIRPGPSKADGLLALEKILADELKTPIHFTPREVEREVIVAKGRYRFQAIGDVAGERAVHLATDALNTTGGGGGGSGSLREMLDWIGDRTRRLVIGKTESSNEGVQWHDHLMYQVEEIRAESDSGRGLRRRLLENVSKQTSLTFREERRKVKVWFLARG